MIFDKFPQYFDMEGVPVWQEAALADKMLQIYRGNGKWEDYDYTSSVLRNGMPITKAEFDRLVAEFDEVDVVTGDSQRTG